MVVLIFGVTFTCCRLQTEARKSSAKAQTASTKKAEEALAALRAELAALTARAEPLLAAGVGLTPAALQLPSGAAAAPTAPLRVGGAAGPTAGDGYWPALAASPALARVSDVVRLVNAAAALRRCVVLVYPWGPCLLTRPLHTRSADLLGMPDYALAAAGACYVEGRHWTSGTRVPHANASRPERGPRTALEVRERQASVVRAHPPPAGSLLCRRTRP